MVLKQEALEVRLAQAEATTAELLKDRMATREGE
jgi:hypothetical protein